MVVVTHYYMVRNDEGSREHHADIDGARRDIIDAIITKMGTARSIAHQVECAEGIIMASGLHSIEAERVIYVGRDSFYINERDCYDSCKGGW